jgi:UDPglucose 6-dehydrogenase
MVWASKKYTNDTRESAAIYVADYLSKVTSEQIYSDFNYLGNRSDEENRRLLKVVTDPKKAVENAHATPVLKEWDEFTEFNWREVYNSVLQLAFLFDGCVLLDQ